MVRRLFDHQCDHQHWTRLKRVGVGHKEFPDRLYIKSFTRAPAASLSRRGPSQPRSDFTQSRPLTGVPLHMVASRVKSLMGCTSCIVQSVTRAPGVSRWRRGPSRGWR